MCVQNWKFVALPVPEIIFIFISGDCSLFYFKFCAHIHRIDRNKVPFPLKISGKVDVGVLRTAGDSKIFRTPIGPYIGASRSHLCGSSALLCM